MARLTLLDLKAVVSHALHGADPDAVWTDAETTKRHTVNQAGRHLFSMHGWSWKDVPGGVSARVVAGQPYLEVPYDFDGLVDVFFDNSASSRVIMSDRVTVERLRSSIVSDASVYYGYLSYPSQRSSQRGPPLPRIELHPTPTSATASSVRLVYEPGWIELVGDTAVPNIPVKYEWLLTRLVAAFAKMQDDEDVVALSVITQSPEYAALKTHDGMRQKRAGPPSGGMVDYGRVFNPIDIGRPYEPGSITSFG